MPRQHPAQTINPPALGFNTPHRLCKARGNRQAARAGVCLPSSPTISNKDTLTLSCCSPSAPLGSPSPRLVKRQKEGVTPGLSLLGLSRHRFALPAWDFWFTPATSPRAAPRVRWREGSLRPPACRMLREHGCSSRTSLEQSSPVRFKG